MGIMPWYLPFSHFNPIILGIYCEQADCGPVPASSTQDSASNSNTYWIMDLKKNLEFRGLATTLLSIFDILHHTVHAFTRFRTTFRNSSSATNITLPRYLNDLTIPRGST